MARTKKFWVRKHVPSIWEDWSNSRRARQMGQRAQRSRPREEMMGMPNRTICHIVSRTDRKELTMRQTTWPAVRQASYPLAIVTIGATVVTFPRRSVLKTHRTQHHQLGVRRFRARVRVRAILNRRRRHPSSSNSNPSSTKCPL